jgi:hypothetical protein
VGVCWWHRLELLDSAPDLGLSGKHRGLLLFNHY